MSFDSDNYNSDRPMQVGSAQRKSYIYIYIYIYIQSIVLSPRKRLFACVAFVSVVCLTALPVPRLLWSCTHRLPVDARCCYGLAIVFISFSSFVACHYLGALLRLLWFCAFHFPVFARCCCSLALAVSLYMIVSFVGHGCGAVLVLVGSCHCLMLSFVSFRL